MPINWGPINRYAHGMAEMNTQKEAAERQRRLDQVQLLKDLKLAGYEPKDNDMAISIDGKDFQRVNEMDAELKKYEAKKRKEYELDREYNPPLSRPDQLAQSFEDKAAEASGTKAGQAESTALARAQELADELRNIPKQYDDQVSRIMMSPPGEEKEARLVELQESYKSRLMVGAHAAFQAYAKVDRNPPPNVMAMFFAADIHNVNIAKVIYEEYDSATARRIINNAYETAAKLGILQHATGPYTPVPQNRLNRLP